MRPSCILPLALSINLGKTLLIVLCMNTCFLVIAQENQGTSKNIEGYSAVNLNNVSTGTLLFQQTGSQRFLQVPQLKTTVDIKIKGIVANVKVKQKFTNTTDEWQHALYAFPLPDNSAVNQLKITVAARVIVGEVQEKKQAIKTFNKAKKMGQKAALVEQHRPNLFTTKVANIPPHETIEVELNYFQQIDYEAEEFSLHFPMAITPRYQPIRSLIQGKKVNNSLPALIYQARNSYQAHNSSRSSKAGNNNLATDLAHKYADYPQDVRNGSSPKGEPFDKQLIDLNLQLSAGAELAQINSVNHTLIAREQGQKRGEYALNLINQPMDKDFVLTWKYSQKKLPQVLNFQQKYQDHDYGLLMVLPGQGDNNNESRIKTNRELTFVLDTSGSMHGQSLEQAKQAFKYALKSLTTDDSFQVISFNSYPTKLFKKPVLANETNKQNAWRYVRELASKGGTEIQSALALVLDEKSNKNEKLQQIVFLTDGAVGNEAEIFSYISNNISQKRLFTVGLGTAPNRYFMKKAAEIGRGSYQFISNHSELVKEMERLFTKLSNPVLTDLKLSLNEPNGELVTTPNPIPDVYQSEPLFLSYKLLSEKPSGSLLTGIYKGSPWSLNIKGYVHDNVYDKQEGNVKRQQAELKTPLLGEPVFEERVHEDLVYEERSDKPPIPPLATLWARRKIADHYRQLMLYKDTQAKANIIELALNYQLVTPFTSLVAVEKKISRPQSLPVNAKQLKNNLPAGQKLPSTALNWQWQFYLGVCLLGFSGFFMFFITYRENFFSKEKLYGNK